MSARTRVAGLVASWSRKAASMNMRPQAAAMSSVVGSSSAAAHAGDAVTQEAPVSGQLRSLSDLSDQQVLHLLKAGSLSPHRLEADLGDATRAVHIRRAFVVEQLAKAGAGSKVSSKPVEAMNKLPSEAFDHDGFYNSILNTNCEAVIGYVPLPVGIVGPLVMDGRSYYVPMATTEGALVASTNRGCAAIRRAGGATTVVMADGMTRAPLVRMPSLAESATLKAWVEQPANFQILADAFNSTSRFGRLRKIQVATAGRNVYLRFKCFTGDAMGMNMITKGVNEALLALHKHFPAMRVLSLSGNFCTDKKPSAINWVDGRGKSVSAEVRLSGHVLKTVLKTTADAMVELNTAKNLVGSALAGSVGGFNAHASNILTAVYLATGQDPAQNVESSTCLTLMEKDASIVDPVHDPEGLAGPGIVMTVTMPSVEVGTVGGGTSLPAQAAALELLGLRGSSQERPGANSEQLARVIAASVLAGELSLMSALTTNDLLKSHMKLNRKPSGEDSTTRGHAVTEAMLAKLRELEQPGVKTYTTVYTPAQSGAAPTTTTTTVPAAAGDAASGINNAVPGGAPAGSHPHPLHMGGAAKESHPGRRHFAAPTHAHGLATRSGANMYGRAAAQASGFLSSALAASAPGASLFAPASHRTASSRSAAAGFSAPMTNFADAYAMSAGVDEEGRGMAWSRVSQGSLEAWERAEEEHALPVP